MTYAETELASSPPAASGAPGEWSVWAMRWAWFALLAIALASRLLGLGAYPLAPEEIARAMPSLDAARGAGWSVTTESPLLLVGNAFFFSVLTATDGLARLIPALAGVGLVTLPLLWRRELGELGALVAAGLLVFSPLTLFAARRLDPVAPASLAAGLIVTLMLRRGAPDAPQRRRFSLLFAGALGLGFIAGANFYDLLLPGLFVWYLLSYSRRGRPGRGRTEETLGGKVQSGWIEWRWGLLIAVVLATAFSIALGFRWSGWAGIADGAAAWITSWGERNARLGGGGNLLLYEPLLLLLLIVGIGLTLRRGPTDRGGGEESVPENNVYSWAIVLWGVASLLIAVLRSGEPVHTAVAVIPLALVGGGAVGRLLEGLSIKDVKWGGLHALAAFVFWLPGLLALVQHARGTFYEDQLVLVIVGVIVLLALQALLVFLFAFFSPRPYTLWRSTLIGFGAVLLVLQMSFAFGLGFVRYNSPVEPAVRSATSEDLRHLKHILLDLAVLRNQRQDSLPVAVIDEDAALTSVLRWDLREFDALEVVELWPTDPDVLVIAPANATIDQPPLWDGLRGMDFVAFARYDAPVPSCQELVPPACADFLKWYFYRISPYEVLRRSVILWQADLSPSP